MVPYESLDNVQQLQCSKRRTSKKCDEFLTRAQVLLNVINNNVSSLRSIMAVHVKKRTVTCSLRNKNATLYQEHIMHDHLFKNV